MTLPRNLKCVCPNEDDRNEITNRRRLLTIDQAAAVASGYQPCCAEWVQSDHFVRSKPDRAEVVSLFSQELMQAIACRELKSVPNPLKRRERLVDRQLLTRWLADRKLREDLIAGVEETEEPLVMRRAQAIRDLIKAHGLNHTNITNKQKKGLFLDLKDKSHDLSFTEDTFQKAWLMGNKKGWWSIKNKKHFTKHL